MKQIEKKVVKERGANVFVRACLCARKALSIEYPSKGCKAFHNLCLLQLRVCVSVYISYQKVSEKKLKEIYKKRKKNGTKQSKE